MRVIFELFHPISLLLTWMNKKTYSQWLLNSEQIVVKLQTFSIDFWKEKKRALDSYIEVKHIIDWSHILGIKWGETYLKLNHIWYFSFFLTCTIHKNYDIGHLLCSKSKEVTIVFVLRFTTSKMNRFIAFISNLSEKFKANVRFKLSITKFSIQTFVQCW